MFAPIFPEWCALSSARPDDPVCPEVPVPALFMRIQEENVQEAGLGERREKEESIVDLIWFISGFLFCEKVLVEGVSCTQETAEGFRLPGSNASV